MKLPISERYTCTFVILIYKKFPNAIEIILGYEFSPYFIGICSLKLIICRDYESLPNYAVIHNYVGSSRVHVYFLYFVIVKSYPRYKVFL